jgi:hypothetical protein
MWRLQSLNGGQLQRLDSGNYALCPVSTQVAWTSGSSGGRGCRDIADISTGFLVTEAFQVPRGHHKPSGKAGAIKLPR